MRSLIFWHVTKQTKQLCNVFRRRSIPSVDVLKSRWIASAPAVMFFPALEPLCTIFHLFSVKCLYILHPVAKTFFKVLALPCLHPSTHFVLFISLTKHQAKQQVCQRFYPSGPSLQTARVNVINLLAAATDPVCLVILSTGFLKPKHV